MYVVMHCSLVKSGRLICIGRSWEFRFAMSTSVRVKRFTGSSGKTSLDLSRMFFKDRLLSLQKMAVLLHKVAAGKLPLIMTSCIILSREKVHYFGSTFHSAFLRFGFHSCPIYIHAQIHVLKLGEYTLPAIHPASQPPPLGDVGVATVPLSVPDEKQ